MLPEIESYGSDKFIVSKSIRWIPEGFHGIEKFNLNEASRYCKDIEEIQSVPDREVERMHSLVMIHSDSASVDPLSANDERDTEGGHK